MQDDFPSILQIFNEYLLKGGEEASVDRIFHALEANNHPVIQCRFASSEWVGDGRNMPVYEQALRMIYNPAAARKLSGIHDKAQPDLWLLHNVFPVGSTAVYRQAIRLNMPLVYFIHNYRPFSVSSYLWANGKVETAGLQRNFWPEIRAGAWQASRLKTAWYAMIIQYMHWKKYYDRISAWIAISDFMKDVFVDAGIPKEKVYTLRHSWQAMDTPPPHQDEGYYVFLGSLIEMKGIPTLLSCWKSLETNLGDACPELRIAGEGPLADQVCAAAAASTKIQYLGRVSGDAKHALIRGCRAFIAPSVWWEPLGLVTYEAYDYGKPMLAARSGGLAETVIHGETGFLHEPGNAEELARQIIEVDQNESLRISMGEKGRIWLLAHTQPEKWLTNFRMICNEAVARHRKDFPG